MKIKLIYSLTEAKYLKQINQRFKLLSNWYKNYLKTTIKVEYVENNPTTSQSIISGYNKPRSKSVSFKNSAKSISYNEANDSQIESIECSFNEDSNVNQNIPKKSQNSFISSKLNKMPVVIVTEPKRKRARSHGPNDSLKKIENNLDINGMNINDESNCSYPFYSSNNFVDNKEKGLRLKLIQDNELLPLSFAEITMKDFQFD